MERSTRLGDLKTLFTGKKPDYRNIDQKAYFARLKRRHKAAFQAAMEARKFEIQLYWTRTAYFWTLTGAALAGFFASIEKIDGIYSFTVACIGLTLALGWALANKGSKYWQENWENHVQLLEDDVIGPLHKTLLYRSAEPMKFRYDFVSQLLTGPSGFSVSKINSIFSWFFFCIWLVLAVRIIPKTGISQPFSIDWSYFFVTCVTVFFLFILVRFSRSWVNDQEHEARVFEERVIVRKPN